MDKCYPKYSIILPVYNGECYIEEAISSVISQTYDDYELIISNNQSTDNTLLLLEKYKENSKIKIFHTPRLFTFAEHFDWAQTHACGEWQIYLGADDGLQPYFFQIADKLTKIANRKKLRSITSKRAYFFWKDCAVDYENTAISYYAKQAVSVENSKKELYRCMHGKRECGFFDLPQMYTTSLFHCSLINEIRNKQNGVLLPLCVIGQDFQLAALALSVEDQFLQSEIPLGWVGTSARKRPNVNMSSDDVDITYLSKIETYDIMFWYVVMSLIGNWQLNEMTRLKSRRIMTNVFAYALCNLKKKNCLDSIPILLEYIEYKKLSIYKVKCGALFIQVYELLLKYIHKILIFPWRCIRYVLKRIPQTRQYFKECSLYISWSEAPDMTMKKASELVMELVSKNFNLKE